MTEQLLQVFQVLQEMFLLCIYLLLRIVLLLNEIYHLPEQLRDVLFELHVHISEHHRVKQLQCLKNFLTTP